MNQIELLTRQTEDAYNWVNKLVFPIPDEKWDIIPEVIESSISWQAGHLVISFYYHSILVIAGHQMDILQQVPLRDYAKRFHNTTARQSAGQIPVEELKKNLHLMEQKSLGILRALPESELEKPLEPSQAPHPIAKTKFEALDWNIKHTLWHCGQIATLKRIVDERYDFGLR